MLKSEALEQLSAIADDDNRDFEDFAAAYKTMEEVVKEYPELSHYVLPIVVQTAADKGFNADIRRLRRQKPRFCALRTGKRRQCSILLSVRQRKKKIFPASSIARWGRFIRATRR